MQLGPEAERELVKSLKEGRRAARESVVFRQQEHYYAVIYWLLLIFAASILLGLVIRKWQNTPYLPVVDEKD